MPYKALQKIVKNGTSWQITLPRKLMFSMELLPGDPILVWTTDDGVAHFKAYRTDVTIEGRSPGLLPDHPQAGKP